MNGSDKQRERFLHDVLRRIARQQCTMILQPGDAWVIEDAVVQTAGIAEALNTCHMRGWVEVLSQTVPTSEVGPDGKILKRFETQPVYRLTEAGWNTINRSHAWEVFACLIALVSLVVSLVALLK